MCDKAACVITWEWLLSTFRPPPLLLHDPFLLHTATKRAIVQSQERDRWHLVGTWRVVRFAFRVLMNQVTELTSLNNFDDGLGNLQQLNKYLKTHETESSVWLSFFGSAVLNSARLCCCFLSYLTSGNKQNHLKKSEFVQLSNKFLFCLSACTCVTLSIITSNPVLSATRMWRGSNLTHIHTFWQIYQNGCIFTGPSVPSTSTATTTATATH